MTQLITVDRVGGMESLHFKLKGVDLRRFGRAEIERTTDIEWNEPAQKWQVRFLRLGRLSGSYLRDSEGRLRLFDEYDDAVGAEILAIQDLRRLNLV